MNDGNQGHTFGIMYELCLLCVLNFGIYVLTEIFKLHWWSKSH